MTRTRLLATMLISLLGIFGLSQAYAQEPAPQPTADGANAVGACLDDDQVWLVVVDDEGNVLANQCVGTPESGEAALDTAGLERTVDSDGFICAIGNHPDPCPETFTGQYWGYYTAAAGEQWGYYEVGADQSEPQPGTIEGWCYNSADEEFCNPPLLQVVIDDTTVLGEGVTEADLVELEVTAEQPTSTDEPTTEAPATDAPATEEPATEEPVTEEPSSPEPTGTDETATEEPADDAADEGATSGSAIVWVLVAVGAVVIIAIVVFVVRGRAAASTDEPTDEVSGGR